MSSSLTCLRNAVASLVIGSSLLLSPVVFASTDQCGELGFLQQDLGEGALVPTMVRHVTVNDKVVEYNTEIIPLNEQVDDFLFAHAAGTMICLRGRPGSSGLKKIFAFGVALSK